MAEFRNATPEEIERARHAVRAKPWGQALLSSHGARAVAADHRDECFVWLYDRDPDSVLAGEEYSTIFVRFAPERPPHVACFRSRRREDGSDDTII